MSQRAFTAKLDVSSDDEVRAALWRTHRVFNERLRWVLRQMHRMKRGELDPRYTEIFESISTSQGAPARLEAVTSLDWNPKKEKAGWRKSAAELIGEGKLLFDRERELPGLSKEFRRKLFEGASQLISGYRELVADWEKEHDEWVKERKKWEADNQEYMAIRPELEAFEAEHGQAAKRRQRWHKWLAFLRSRPDLAAWRGGPAIVNELDEAAKRCIEKARPNKRNKVAADEFFKKNPELKALDILHGYYQREYVRPWAESPNPDGFKHRPTFTEPSPEKHCFWFQFKKGETYKELKLETCSLRLQVLASDAVAPGWEWRAFKFRPDPRLCLIRKSEDTGLADAAKFTYVFSDPALGIDRPAEIRGAKLVFRPARPDGNIYLYFTLETPDLPCRLKIKQESCDKYGSRWLCDKICKELDGAAPVTCAVDLGIRHLAAATVRRDKKIVRARMIREDDRRDGGPRLPAIAAHKRKLAAKRRERGKPVRGEESCIKLQKHVDDMGEDRVKKGARRIVNFAHQNGCDLIIMEKLAGLIPDAERERGINRALVSWNRGHLAKWIKQLAGDAGIRVVEVHPYMTSQLCSHCGAFGARFSADHGQPHFETVGKMFACPECGYTANADHNASVNLHRKFYGELAEVKKIRKGVYRVTKPDQSPVEVEIERIQDRLAPRAVWICRSEPTPF